MKIADVVREMAAEAVTGRGCVLWDVEYAREGGRMVLRLLIDKPGASVSTDDCEAVSRAVDPLLDERDPIPGPYTLEVSSAGLERPLKRPEHFEASIGRAVAVSLYAPENGVKRFTGVLRAYDGDTVGIQRQTEAQDGLSTFDMKAVSKVCWIYQEGMDSKR